MNILNGQEAFTALMTGKNIMCRAVGELIEFNDLDQFPATIFAMPDYEFCIKRETVTLAEIQFTKPVEPHDLVSGQEIFIVMPTCILRTTYDHEHGENCLSVANGFAQLDEENAKLQLQAIGKSFGNMITDIEVKDSFNDKPKKARSSRSKKADFIDPTNNESTDEPWGNIKTPTESTSNDVENKTSDEAKVWKTSAQETHELLTETREMAEAMMVDTTPDPALNSFSLDVDQEIAAKQAIKHQEHLSEILNDIALANTPAEVNAHIRYTRSWTEEQRKPVLTAINKRLVDLTAINPVEISLPPSLMVRIQSASSEHELNELLSEVRSRHPDIQPKLMGYVRARRFELENSATTVVPQ